MHSVLKIAGLLPLFLHPNTTRIQAFLEKKQGILCLLTVVFPCTKQCQAHRRSPVSTDCMNGRRIHAISKTECFEHLLSPEFRETHGRDQKLNFWD